MLETDYIAGHVIRMEIVCVGYLLLEYKICLALCINYSSGMNNSLQDWPPILAFDSNIVLELPIRVLLILFRRNDFDGIPVFCQLSILNAEQIVKTNITIIEPFTHRKHEVPLAVHIMELFVLNHLRLRTESACSG